jgi:hypothetical protein
MTIIPITIFGILSLLYFIVYGIIDVLEWTLAFLGLRERRMSMPPIRGQDPTGMKRARALKEARGPANVVRK